MKSRDTAHYNNNGYMPREDLTISYKIDDWDESKYFGLSYTPDDYYKMKYDTPYRDATLTVTWYGCWPYS